VPPGGAIVQVVEERLELAQLGVHCAGQRSRRRGDKLDADRVQDPQQDRAGRVVTLRLPAADVPPVGPDRSGKLILREAGPFAEVA
jgi:hypothetical protein